MLAKVLSMIHAMVCNAGMTIVCGVCGRTIEYGIVAAACDRAPGFGMRVPFRAPGCADRPTDRARGRRRWTDRQTAPGRAGQTAPGGGATGGEIRLRRRGDRDPGGASASSRARGNFGSGAARPLLTVDLSPQGLGGGEGGRLRRAGMRVRTWRHSARRNPQAFRLETRNPQAFQLPPPGGRNPRLRSQSESGCLVILWAGG